MAGASRGQALSLLAAANNHGDLAVKLSSLKQAKDILRSIDPSSAAELFPYLVELQSSPEALVRKSLVQAVEDIGLKAMENCAVLMPILLALLKDGDSIVAKQSIVTGINFFRTTLEDMVFQFNRRGKVERWLEELWLWMVKFKDAIFTIAMEPGSVGTRLLALKFLETYALLFTSDTNDTEKFAAEVAGSRRAFNISWLVGVHPILEPFMLMSEANRTVGILLNLLQSASSLPGSLAITVVNCLATIARKRPVHYSTILIALLDFEDIRGSHAASILYSIRSALLGFLRCTNPAIIESRERLLRALRAMNAGDAADQVIRQVDKMVKNTERASRDVRMEKDDQFSNQLPVVEDLSNKRHLPLDNEDAANIHEAAFKRVRHGLETHLPLQDRTSDFECNKSSVNGLSLEPPMLDGELTPAEQMIAMIGALLAEGERGAESLEILISKIQPDLLADIVITNMRHLPKAPPPLTRLGNLQVPGQTSSLSSSAHVVVGTSPMNSLQSSALSCATSTTSSMVSDTLSMDILSIDSKRDPRRDPRRLDPRRIPIPSGLTSAPISEDSTTMQPEFDGSILLSKPNLLVDVKDFENPPTDLMSKTKNDENLESKFVPVPAQPIPKEEVLEVQEPVSTQYVSSSSDPADSPVQIVDEDTIAAKLSDDLVKDEGDTFYYTQFDQQSPVLENVSEDTCQDLPELPSYVELTKEQEKNLSKLALKRIIESYKQLCAEECSHMRLALLARLFAQITSDDDFFGMLEKHIVVDYQQQKGHELVLHVLYHLHSLIISGSNESSSSPAVLYENFLLAVAKCLLDSFPASDKSFSRLFGEVPILPDSALKLLDDLCYSDVVDQHGKNTRDIERVTQGLGAVWSLILGHPQYRQACLDIALKCAVHSQDEIRAKAIRLVANKLYQLVYISESIENFATQMLLSAVDHHSSDAECWQPGFTEPRAQGLVGGQEASVSDSQISESVNSENKEQPAVQGVSIMPLSEVQRVISLYFALCTKKPQLLQLVFITYGRAPKTVKQAFHRHIPILIRALGSSYSELLHIISDPPQGSENLLMLVLQVLTQEMTPSPGLISTVKHLYATKLKDVSILIPMLSSLSKNEVLPIFPQLVALPLEKFQKALAHILQGSAHTGPALSPTEVLVAIHGILPEKDGLPLKKITDACSACFEQRTVFTQQVLAKSLTQMVDQTPLPLLFMRTVIQAIDAFPLLVDFVMEILSKLVRRQIWKMPKLWVGFLKCVSQTQPHSFHVLLQLPLPQLESALSKYANLRSPLAAYASQPNVKSSLARSTLAVLGLVNETHMQPSHLSSPFHSSDSNPSVHGATTT